MPESQGVHALQVHICQWCIASHVLCGDMDSIYSRHAGRSCDILFKRLLHTVSTSLHKAIA